MKYTTTVLFLAITLVSFAQKKDTVVRLGMNSVEGRKISKQFRMIDSLNNVITDFWIKKLNAKGFDERDVLIVMPSRRDSLKVKIRK